MKNKQDDDGSEGKKCHICGDEISDPSSKKLGSSLTMWATCKNCLKKKIIVDKLDEIYIT